MNIQEALKETGKARIPTFEEGSYVFLDHNQYKVYDSKNREERVWGFTNLLDNKWQPYHEQKQIVPEKVGELWEHKQTGHFFHTQLMDWELWFTGLHSRVKVSEATMTNMTRIHPPVEEDVERIVIDEGGRALSYSVAAIYFGDSSDYKSALWDIIEQLSPDAKALLENNPKSAYDKYCYK